MNTIHFVPGNKRLRVFNKQKRTRKKMSRKTVDQWLDEMLVQSEKKESVSRIQRPPNTLTPYEKNSEQQKRLQQLWQSATGTTKTAQQWNQKIGWSQITIHS